MVTGKLGMQSQSVDRLLPYPPALLFDLVADVERYPEFLRWWISARIWKRHADLYYTDQVLGLGPVRVRFRSRTQLWRPQRIDVTSEESPFRRFDLSWTFQPNANGWCRVRLAATLELNSRLLQHLVEAVLPAAIGEIISAFEERARKQLGEEKQAGSAPLSVDRAGTGHNGLPVRARRSPASDPRYP